MYFKPKLSNSDIFLDNARVKNFTYSIADKYIAVLWDDTVVIGGLPNNDSEKINKIRKQHFRCI